MNRPRRLLAFLLVAATTLLLFSSCKPSETDTSSDSTPAGTTADVPSSMEITELEVTEGTVTDAVTAQNEYYISPDGSDLNPGTKDQPFRTLYYARDVIAKFKDEIAGDITVYLGGGYYRLFQPLEMTAEQLNKADGGHITFKAVEGETPILSGGLQLKNWVKTTLNGIDGIYKTQVAGLPHIRQFYADNIAQQKAEYGEPIEWAWGDDRAYLKVYGVDLSTTVDLSTAEIVWPISWKVFIVQCQSYDGRELYFQEDQWNNLVDLIDQRVNQNHESEDFYPNITYPLYLYNDISFVDQPGEWFYQESTGELYYYPAEGVDMETSDFFVPVVEDLIHIYGTEDNKVQNVTFEGISFRHGAWNQPSSDGLNINQSQNQQVVTRSKITGNIRVEYTQIPSNITLENANNVSFIGCRFENMGTTALGMPTGIQNCTVEGNVFYQCSEGALTLSSDKASTVTELSICKNNRIANNVIHEIGLDYWSAPAICVYYADTTTVTHNDIYDVPHTGISLGWGWYWTPNSTTSRNNVVSYNRIGKFLQRCRDGGGVYTLGQQPDSFVNNNYIFDQGGAYGGLYHDEGSAYFTTTDNVVDNINMEVIDVNWIHVNGGEGGPNGGKTTYNLEIHNNYYSNDKTSFWGEPTTCDLSGNHLVQNGEWPEEAQTIMNNAGVEEAYKGLLDTVQ